MTIPDNNAVQLWRKAEADVRDAVCLFTELPDGGERVQLLVILNKLRRATAAMQELECRSRNQLKG